MSNKLFVSETEAIINIICAKINDNLSFTCVVAIVVMVILYVQFWLITDHLKDIVKILQLKKPGLVFISFRQGENGMLKFVLVLPEKGAEDVVVRQLQFSIADNPFEVELDGDAVETPEFMGADNDKVVGTLVDIDDAGNRSEPREFSFVLVDNIAPPQPGAMSLKVTGEA